MRSIFVGRLFTFAVIAAITLTVLPANASILWDWNYAGSGITASGTLTTLDTPDGAGGFLITAITGTRNTETIIGLQPTGTPIPGNEPFAVDNLVFAGPGPQLTSHGFGFSTSGGNFSNPFYADFLPAPGYLEFFSNPPFTTELPVQFSAAPVVIPEPASFALAFIALGGAATLRRRVSTHRDAFSKVFQKRSSYHHEKI